MKSLPTSVELYKRTPEFTEETLPRGLLKSHQTKRDVWGRIVILAGSLTYRILEPELSEYELDAESPGIIEPGIQHEVEPHREVRFFIEFYR